MLPLPTNNWRTAQTLWRQEEEIFNATAVEFTHFSFFQEWDELAPNQSFLLALFYGGIHLKTVGYSRGEVECLDM